MQVNVEESGALKRKMTVTLPAEQFDSELDKQLKRLSRSVKLPGFRPGKVPMKIIRSRYQGQVLQDVIGDLINRSYPQALSQESLRPAGAPDIQTNSMGEGKDFEYTAVFEVYPDLSGLKTDALEVGRPVCEITEEDVDRTLESLRQQRVTWSPVKRKAATGDRVTMTFKGSVGGEGFEGGEGKDMPVVLGSKSLIEGFEDQLLGIKAGEEREFDVTFPDSYHNAALAGKTAHFAVTATEVAKQELPDIDEKLAESFGVTEGGIAKFREEVRDNLTRESEERLTTMVRDAVFQALLDSNTIDLPQALVEQELEHLLEVAEKEQPGAATNENARAFYGKLAERRVALGLALAEVTKREKMQPDADKVEQRLASLAESYEDPDRFIQWYKSDHNRMAEIEGQVLELMVVDKLLESAAVTDKSLSFQELVTPATVAPSTDENEESTD
jgi:trigger factor